MKINLTNIIDQLILYFDNPVYLRRFEKSVYSQNGEDGVINAIFKVVGTESKYFVEFGVEDGSQRNSRLLEERGWNGLLMDGEENKKMNVKKEWITAANINKLFRKYDVPENLDLLSIDIDSNDLWVWQGIDKRYKPRLVVCEYNATLPYDKSLTVKRDDKMIWKKDNYFGASLLALTKLAAKKGYTLIYCESLGVNAFFLRNDLLGRLHQPSYNEAFRPPDFGNLSEDGIARTGHEPTSKKFVKFE